MPFEENLYHNLPGVLTGHLLYYIQLNAEITRKVMQNDKPASLSNPYPFGDKHVPKSFSAYGPIWSESMLIMFLPIVERISGKSLKPTYSYTRTYYNGSDLKPHIDRGACEYSVTICIKKGNCEWPIFFKHRKGNLTELNMNDGDAVIYKGQELLHWRKEYHGDEHTQVFLHYVDIDNPNADMLAYDGRHMHQTLELKEISNAS